MKNAKIGRQKNVLLVLEICMVSKNQSVISEIKICEISHKILK